MTCDAVDTPKNGTQTNGNHYIHQQQKISWYTQHHSEKKNIKRYGHDILLDSRPGRTGNLHSKIVPMNILFGGLPIQAPSYRSE